MDIYEKTCLSCKTGECCREGVDVDLEEIKRLSRLKLRLKRPWFEGPFPDKDSSAGWVFGTVVRNRTCVFQDKNKRCLIYEVKPRYCSEFPFENGKLSPYYKRLCDKAKFRKRGERRV